MIDPKLLFWTGALVYMAVMMVCAEAGRQAVLRGDIERHRRLMNLCAWMVVGFIAAYVVKVMALGKEDIFSWSQVDRWILWTHETIVAWMILAGGVARFLARKFDAGGRLTDASLSDPEKSAAFRRRHRLAGRNAVIAGLFAVLTAAAVLVGMYLRA